MMAAWSAAETRTVDDVRVAGDCESGLAVVHLLAHATGEGRALKDAGPGCPRGGLLWYVAGSSRQGRSTSAFRNVGSGQGKHGAGGGLHQLHYAAMM